MTRRPAISRSTASASDEVTQESLRDALAVVPQEVMLFHRSVMENIRFAKPDASDEEVHRAAADRGLRRLHPPPAARL